MTRDEIISMARGAAARETERERDRTVSEAPYRFLNESDTVLLREIVAEVQTAEHLRAEKETT